jgi:2-polyprenyl-3-methyl-5-hydroxy-6-metoxy-1,4-benzoquinol methylase
MDTQAYWEQLYESKSPKETSWYQPHLQTSLDWISPAAKDKSASIIDVGGGESTLVDDLLGAGYRSLTILDVARSAIKKSQGRMGSAAQSVSWLVGDVTTVALPSRAFDVWHDRAVFHFLTKAAHRAAYVGQLVSALKPGGQVIMATFGPQGPHKCSGLDTLRYDRESLQDELGPNFRLVRSLIVQHHTPFGTSQQFLYCHFGLDSAQEGATEPHPSP